jgi:hypothetical protein
MSGKEERASCCRPLTVPTPSSISQGGRRVLVVEGVNASCVAEGRKARLNRNFESYDRPPARERVSGVAAILFHESLEGRGQHRNRMVRG